MQKYICGEAGLLADSTIQLDALVKLASDILTEKESVHIREIRRLMRADTGRMIASLTPEQNYRTRLTVSKEFRQAPLSWLFSSFCCGKIIITGNQG